MSVRRISIDKLDIKKMENKHQKIMTGARNADYLIVEEENENGVPMDKQYIENLIIHVSSEDQKVNDLKAIIHYLTSFTWPDYMTKRGFKMFASEDEKVLSFE
ncbi:12188_t:CDS:2 [Dentiscutata heterogama]|uniref:12188_t:CDS:1 n=1 Tax=Dentiscutata heterogama TaxID=1316150 RepID=A0ACA9KKQ5_9GLOM|nr:12188_t:CDS:2 [Dentiscutata heterogama]